MCFFLYLCLLPCFLFVSLLWLSVLLFGAMFHGLFSDSEQVDLQVHGGVTLNYRDSLKTRRLGYAWGLE